MRAPRPRAFQQAGTVPRALAWGFACVCPADVPVRLRDGRAQSPRNGLFDTSSSRSITIYSPIITHFNQNSHAINPFIPMK